MTKHMIFLGGGSNYIYPDNVYCFYVQWPLGCERIMTVVFGLCVTDVQPHHAGCQP